MNGFPPFPTSDGSKIVRWLIAVILTALLTITLWWLASGCSLKITAPGVEIDLECHWPTTQPVVSQDQPSPTPCVVPP